MVEILAWATMLEYGAEHGTVIAIANGPHQQPRHSWAGHWNIITKFVGCVADAGQAHTV